MQNRKRTSRFDRQAEERSYATNIEPTLCISSFGEWPTGLTVHGTGPLGLSIEPDQQATYAIAGFAAYVLSCSPAALRINSAPSGAC